jgi:WD40 repeat protein
MEQLIASGGHDGTVRLWKLDGTLIATLKAHDAPVSSEAFNPDGQLLNLTVIPGNLSQVIDLHQLDKIACNWVRDYLRTNTNVKEEYRHLCDAI